MLVVDEQEQKSITRLFAEANEHSSIIRYGLTSVGSTSDACYTLRRSTMPHIILIAMELLGTSGLDALPKLRDWAGEEVAIIILSGDPTLEQLCKRRGADEMLLKPLGSEDVSRLWQFAHRRGADLTSGTAEGMALQREWPSAGGGGALDRRQAATAATPVAETAALPAIVVRTAAAEQAAAAAAAAAAVAAASGASARAQVVLRASAVSSSLRAEGTEGLPPGHLQQPQPPSQAGGASGSSNSGACPPQACPPQAASSSAMRSCIPGCSCASVASGASGAVRRAGQQPARSWELPDEDEHGEGICKQQ